MYVISEPDIAFKYDLGNDEIVKDLNTFLTNCVLGIIEPQKIVVEETNDEACKALEDIGFEIILLHSYLKFKKPLQKAETQTTDFFNEKKSEKIVLPKKKEVQPMPKKKTSFFSKLFGSKEKVEEKNQITLDSIFLQVNDVLKEAEQRGAKVKKYCLENNLLTKSQVQYVEKLMDQAISFGEHKRFIQTARDAKQLTEDQAADVLSYITSQEVISKNRFAFDILYPYNAELLNLLTDFFIYKVDDSSKTVYICKDCSIEPKLHLLEKRYMGYHVVTYNVVEGVTKEVLDELKGRATNG